MGLYKLEGQQMGSTNLSSHISISTAPRVTDTQARGGYVIFPNWVLVWTRFKPGQTQT